MFLLLKKNITNPDHLHVDPLLSCQVGDAEVEHFAKGSLRLELQAPGTKPWGILWDMMGYDGIYLFFGGLITFMMVPPSDGTLV